VKYSLSLALFALAAFAAPMPAVCAEHEVALSQVAAQLGYAYAYLGPEDAVQLSRPGLVILVRPGEKLIDVNDRTETIDVAPRFVRDDLFVTDAFIGRLRQLAWKYPSSPRGNGDETPVVVIPKLDRSAQVGAISLDVHQVPGSQTLSVSGKAPASAPITLTLKETFWTEIPDVVLNRTEITADADGHFEAVVPVAPGYFHGGIITVLASSLPRITTASAKIVLKAPNDGVDVPAQQIPKSIR
jgi:hypothetical protein